MAFKITTTGTVDPMVFNDLGARSFPHPTVDYDLSRQYSAEEISASNDVAAAIAAGEITAKDADDNPITDSTNAFIPLSTRGMVNGVATLDGGGKVPAAQLPESAGGFKGFGIWRYRTEVTSTPTSGRLNFDDTIVDNATEMYVNVINDGGTDVSAFLALLAVDNLIYIQAQDDATQFIVVKVGSVPTLLSGVYTIPIGTVESQGAAMTNNETVAVLGDTGSAAPAVKTPIVVYVNGAHSGSSYKVEGRMIWVGSTLVGVPTSISGIAFVDNDEVGDIRIYDATNALEIAELIGISSNDLNNLEDFGTLTNISAGEAVWEFQIRQTSGDNDINLRGVAVYL